MLQPDPNVLLLFPTFDAYQKQVSTLVYDSLFLPLEMVTEIAKLNDLLEVCYFKYSLFELAQLQSVMIFEKALRIKLYKEYKTITKIKLSVLLDKALQSGLLHKQVIAHLRTLKDLRNKTVHHATKSLDASEAIQNIALLIASIHELFPPQDMYFIVLYDTETQTIIQKLRYGFSFEEVKNYKENNEELYPSTNTMAYKLIYQSSDGKLEDCENS